MDVYVFSNNVERRDDRRDKNKRLFDGGLDGGLEEFGFSHDPLKMVNIMNVYVFSNIMND